MQNDITAIKPEPDALIARIKYDSLTKYVTLTLPVKGDMLIEELLF